MESTRASLEANMLHSGKVLGLDAFLDSGWYSGWVLERFCRTRRQEFLENVIHGNTIKIGATLDDVCVLCFSERTLGRIG